MTQAYSDPTRIGDPYSLPDVEIFPVPGPYHAFVEGEREDATLEPGWYYWYCCPGCLPDSEPIGPFASEADVLADAQGDREPMALPSA